MVVFALNSDLICNTNYMYMFNVHGMCVSHCFLETTSIDLCYCEI